MKYHWDSLAFWKEKYRSDPTLKGPFWGEPITERSVFIWTEMAAPLPCCTSGGEWDYFPEPKTLAACLRYLLFPRYFEVWLARDEWDPGQEVFLASEELFKRAEGSEKCSYLEEIPLMCSLIKEFDGILRRQGDIEAVRELREVAAKFNERWENTPSWNFRVLICDDPIEVGEAVWNKYSGDEESFIEQFGISHEEWVGTCSAAISDPDSQRRFLEILKEDFQF